MTDTAQPNKSLILTILGWIVKLVVGLIITALILALLAFITVKFFGISFALNYISKRTGFSTTIKDENLNLLGGRIELQDLHIANTPDFQNNTFIHVPKVVLDVQLSTLAKEPYHIEEITLHLQELDIVTNKRGEMNANLFSAALNSQDSAPANKPTKETKQAQQSMPQVRIDRLRLKVDTIRIIDERSSPARISTVNVGLDIDRSNVTDLAALQRDISQVVFNLVLRKAGPALVNELSGSAISEASKAADVVSQITGDALGTTTEAAGEAVDEATKKIDNAAKGIKSFLNKIKPE